jgi:hypothetical protein
MSGDPAETALYLRRVYATILDGYFDGFSFFKPTGDGLLLVIPFDPTEADLARTTKAVVADALRLVRDFPTLVDGDKLIKFPSPKAIGIGIAAGSVSRISAEDITLDYTGRPLNVASRLMDLARPAGVVLDGTLDFDALAPTVRQQFAADHVYLKGVADTDGVEILYTAELTRIPDRYRNPLTGQRLHVQSETMTMSAAKRRRSWNHRLEFEPADRTQLEAFYIYSPYRNGEVDTSVERSVEITTGRYLLDRGKPTFRLDYGTIVRRPGINRLRGRDSIRIEIAYPVSD